MTVNLNSSQSIDDTFHVVIVNSDNKIMTDGDYSIGGTISFSDSGSSTMVYTVKITNRRTRKSATYGTITVNYSTDPIGSSKNFNSSAFASTL